MTNIFFLIYRTTYRIRVKPLIILSEKENSQSGEWSDIISLTTLEPQTIDPNSCANHATFQIKNNDKIITFTKSGLVYSIFDYKFGIISWEAKLQIQSPILSLDDCACLKVGIISKNGKNWTVIGSTINYGFTRNNFFKVKVVLDCEKGILSVFSANFPNGEIFNNLSKDGWFPAFQNKTMNNSNYVLQIIVNFN